MSKAPNEDNSNLYIRQFIIDKDHIKSTAVLFKGVMYCEIKYSRSFEL